MTLLHLPYKSSLVCAALLSAAACSTQRYEEPQFADFTYQGSDTRFDAVQAGPKQYLNPIISGCAPDPSVTRKGDDYYMVNSSFVYFPGVPVWHSRNLVDWELVGYALDRPSQLMLGDGTSITAGVYAPDIQYNPANDTFYLITTVVGGDHGGNFVVKTHDPAAGWSDPIWLPEVGGIDPSLLFDSDGRAYIVNNDAPAGAAEYDGHRAIWIREYDVASDRTVGPARVLVDKGVHPDQAPIWIEGPHLYHVGDAYYLMCAEGGTAEGHSEVVFQSQGPDLSFKPCQTNPVLSQRDLPHRRAFPTACAGHADLIQTADGDWWAVFLAVNTYPAVCQPADTTQKADTLCDRFANTGRSTFLLPVDWSSGQPIILGQGQSIPVVADRPSLPSDGKAGRRALTGNISYKDDFDGDTLDPMWLSLRTPLETWHTLANGALRLTPRPIRLDERRQPSMLCRWVKNADYTATTTLNFTPQSDKMLAGMTVFQNEQAHYIIGKTLDPRSGQPSVVLLRAIKADAGHESGRRHGTELVAFRHLEPQDANRPLSLRIQAKGEALMFAYATRNRPYIPLGDVQDAKPLSSAATGDFTGNVIGLYATSANDASWLDAITFDQE